MPTDSLYLDGFARCAGSELSSELGAEGDAAQLADPALEADIGSGVCAHRRFPAELETAGEALQRRRRRGVAHAARHILVERAVLQENIVELCRFFLSDSYCSIFQKNAYCHK